MGTWSFKPFGNDGALDWFGELETTNDVNQFFETTLNQECLDDDIMDVAEEAIAAAAIIAASAKDKVLGLPVAQKEWILVNAYVPKKVLIELAINFLESALTNPNLREELEEDGLSLIHI